MYKEFNITGNCVPEKHYMAPLSGKIGKLIPYITSGKYFVIKGARQFGKTTILNELRKTLKNDYLIINISFEGTDDTVWESTQSFCKWFANSIASYFKYSDVKKSSHSDFWNLQESNISNFRDLSIAITDFCTQNNQKVVLMIDEADVHRTEPQFHYFMMMLRDKYIRQNNNQDHTIHSVILSSVADLTLSMPASSSNEAFHSPWNIAANVDINLSISAEDTETMLTEYENDYKTGMDIKTVAGFLQKYSNGYPYLISKICHTIHEKLGRNFCERTVEQAINIMVRENNPLFKDMTMRISQNQNYEKLLTQVLINRNNQIIYDPNVPILSEAMEQSVIRENENGNVMIHNIIFQKVLLSYFISSLAISNTFHIPNTQYAGKDNMNLELLISQFAQLPLGHRFNKEYLADNWRLLFISFLKPIVNRMGFYYIIQNSTENLRMTIVARYNNENYIIELNDYYGSPYETAGEILVANDANKDFGNKGYVITYNHALKETEKSQTDPEWINVDGKKIFKATL